MPSPLRGEGIKIRAEDYAAEKFYMSNSKSNNDHVRLFK